MSAILSVELVVVSIGFHFHEKIENRGRRSLIQEATLKFVSLVRETSFVNVVNVVLRRTGRDIFAGSANAREWPSKRFECEVKRESYPSPCRSSRRVVRFFSPRSSPTSSSLIVSNRKLPSKGLVDDNFFQTLRDTWPE